MGFGPAQGEGGGGGAGGDIVGPASSVDGEVVLFNGTTGKLVKAGTASGTDCLSIGPGASGAKEDVCIGDTATATHPGGDCVIIGFNASASRSDGVCVGHTARGTGVGSNYVAIGSGATATSSNCIALGQGSTAGGDATAIGQGSTAGTNGIGIGKGSNGAGDNIAIGIDAIATVFSGSVCIGRGSGITAAEQVVFGSSGTPITDFQTGGHGQRGVSLDQIQLRAACSQRGVPEHVLADPGGREFALDFRQGDYGGNDERRWHLRHW